MRCTLLYAVPFCRPLATPLPVCKDNFPRLPRAHHRSRTSPRRHCSSQRPQTEHGTWALPPISHRAGPTAERVVVYIHVDMTGGTRLSTVCLAIRSGPRSCGVVGTTSAISSMTGGAGVSTVCLANCSGRVNCFHDVLHHLEKAHVLRHALLRRSRGHLNSFFLKTGERTRPRPL